MKKEKGTVGIETNNGRLRLRLPRHLFGGKQTYLYLGLADNKANRKVASAKAGMIEADIIFERFDETLEKYKSQVFKQSDDTDTNLQELWAKYTEFKSQFLSHSSLKDFKRIANHIPQFPSQSPNKAKLIAKFCRDNFTPDTARRILMQLNACCDWALNEELIESNPFSSVRSYSKSLQSRSINPFSTIEKALIIQAFKQQKEHQHYWLLVEFLFATGCRTSEAVGLKKRHIESEFKFIDFSEAVVDGRRKQTKTGKARQFPVNHSLKNLLILLNLNSLEPDAAIFADTQGNLVRPNNFLRRHWQPVVKSLGIPYRPQYNTRHTFITQCLQADVPVAQVAAWVGNSPRVIWEHYAGFIPSEVPEF